MTAFACYFCATPVADATAPKCAKCGRSLILRGRYRVVRVLGQGGFGVVYAAIDQHVAERQCAVKQVASFSLQSQRQIEAEIQFLARYATRFQFIPDIYDVWSEDGQSFMVMEFIAGDTLNQLMERPWSADTVQHFLTTLLGYLGELHSVGVIHRDIKPNNIIRTPQGRYVLLDFGISKEGNITMTAARALSLDYASLEQFQGQSTDARSDLFSLAATAYHLLTGQPPTRADSRRLNGQPIIAPSQLVPHVPAALERTLLAMLALDPAQRPANAEAVLNLLHNVSVPTEMYYPAENVVRVVPVRDDAAATVAASQPIAAYVTPPAPGISQPNAPYPPYAAPKPTAKRPPLWAWALGGLLLLGLVAGGTFAFLARRGDPGTTNQPTVVGHAPTPPAVATARPTATLFAVDQPTITVGVGIQPPITTPTLLPAPAQKLVPLVVNASNQAASGQDAQGNPITYNAANAVDGDPTTAWRVAGAGIGESLTLSFGEQLFEISEIQLLPGYAKIDPFDGSDRFSQNRRVRLVRFEFGDGTTIEQRYSDEARLQSASVPNVRSNSVRIVIVETSEPGAVGGRDFTPISEVVVLGRRVQ